MTVLDFCVRLLRSSSSVRLCEFARQLPRSGRIKIGLNRLIFWVLCKVEHLRILTGHSFMPSVTERGSVALWEYCKVITNLVECISFIYNSIIVSKYNYRRSCRIDTTFLRSNIDFYWFPGSFRSYRKLLQQFQFASKRWKFVVVFWNNHPFFERWLTKTGQPKLTNKSVKFLGK